MIVTCPSCDTRFRVDDAALVDGDGRPRSRELRCAKCGHTWRHVPAPEPDPPAITPSAAEPPVIEPSAATPTIDPPAAPTIEPRIAEPDAVGPQVAPIVEPAAPAPRVDSPLGERVSPAVSPQQRSGWAGIGWLVLIVVAAATIAALVLGRNQIAAAWPPMERFYHLVGIGLAPTSAGLQIGKVSPTRTADALIIEGDITNVAGSPRALPKLRIALRDPSGRELAFKIIDPPVAQLAPGAVAHFRTPFERPDDAATDIAVTFAAG
jgi:predicted Zn finger-like uncharacterized protein